MKPFPFGKGLVLLFRAALDSMRAIFSCRQKWVEFLLFQSNIRLFWKATSRVGKI